MSWLTIALVSKPLPRPEKLIPEVLTMTIMGAASAPGWVVGSGATDLSGDLCKPSPLDGFGSRSETG